MRIFHSDRYTLPLPPGHAAPGTCASGRHARVRRQADPDWQLHEAPPASRAALTRVHTAAYVAQVLEHGIGAAAERRLGLPWSPALAARSLHSVGGTLAACAAAHTDGIAVNLAGGTHHAGATAGAGFCVFNDVAVAALDALHSGAARHVLVVDCDVHQGDGTAALLATHPAAYTFSIHAARNYPHRKARSRLDIALPDRCGDADYLDLLAGGLEHALAVARPGLAIYLAGADPWAGDRLGRLALSKSGIAARDELVLRALEAAGCRVAVVMGGGYADAVTDIVDIHMGTVRAAGASWRRRRA